MLLIPAIDLRAGRCVRLREGNFDDETGYATGPRELLERFSALGAPWLHVVDLDGARSGAGANRELIVELATATFAAIARTPRLQAGGGVRSVAAAEGLLCRGVARVVVGSLAVERPSEVASWVERFGAERVVLAFDVRIHAAGEPRLHTHGWTQGGDISLWDAVDRCRLSGLRHVLCTDIARDGTLLGPNLDLYADAVRRFPHLEWQASGGVRDAGDLAALAGTGVAAAVCGKALLENRITAEESQLFWRDASSRASTSATARS